MATTKPPKKKPGRKPRPKDSPRKTGTASGKLTPRGTRAKRAHYEAHRTVEKARRRAEVLRLYADHNMNMQQVADALSVSLTTVCRDLHETFDELRQNALDKAEDLRLIEDRRSHRNDRAILPLLYGKLDDVVVDRNRKGEPTRVLRAKPQQIAMAQLRAHERLTASSRFRAELHGAMAPVKVTPTDITGTRPYEAVPTEELESMLSRRLEALGLSAPALPDIDVTTNGDGER